MTRGRFEIKMPTESNKQFKTRRIIKGIAFIVLPLVSLMLLAKTGVFARYYSEVKQTVKLSINPVTPVFYCSDGWYEEMVTGDDSVAIEDITEITVTSIKSAPSEYIKVFNAGTDASGNHAGTTYSAEHIGKEYARIDNPEAGMPGYFTGIAYKPASVKLNINYGSMKEISIEER